VPLGCCGSWLLILSLLPSVFGNTLSVILIQYSKPLSYLGLFIVIGYTAFTAIKLKRKLKSMQIPEAQRKITIM
jgi:ABC-type Na+ efflux pump permease subunit